jgi:hypothetical protein
MIPVKIRSIDPMNLAIREIINTNTGKASQLAGGIVSCSTDRLGRFTRGAIYEALKQAPLGILPERVKELLQKEFGKENEIFTKVKAFIEKLDFEYKQRGKMEFSPILPNGNWSHLTIRLKNGSHGKTITIGDNTPCNRIVIDVHTHALWVFGSLGRAFEIVKISDSDLNCSTK